MGRRYYCEYCDRAFTDVVDSRRKHLKGISHERLKKIYYSKLRDLKTLVEEERQKEVCRRHRCTGACPFEDACTFTHYTPKELDSFEFEVEQQKKKSSELPALPSTQEWLKKRSANITHSATRVINIYGSNNPLNNYNCQSLPRSLQPISFQHMLNTELLEWD